MNRQASGVPRTAYGPCGWCSMEPRRA
uniref:Uncharacterized protein n=1 Tax=Arundo donax TaxID=35708 RepID=A0A0A9GV41_ARUDO